MTPRTATAKATPLATEYLVHSDLLGDFTIRAESAVEFPRGLLGFADATRFALVRAGTDTVYWLQSLDHSSLVFLLVDPFVHFNEYSIEIAPADVVELGATNASDIAILAIVTLPTGEDGVRPTANLQGPIAVNLKMRRGKQIISADADYGVRCEFDFQQAQ